MKIPFNKPCIVGNEYRYIEEAVAGGHLSGDGVFTKKCNEWLEKKINCQKALLTHSCTAALEMAAILTDIQPGDEVIMPSYTFVSTANAFVLRGGIPVFVDVRSDTLNIDETQIEAAITARTKAIVAVHYAGVGCEMDTIMAIAKKYNLIVIEDAAQGIVASYKGRPLGSIGNMAALSFHETKNIISGEGGALLINDSKFVGRAEIIRQKGTNRNQFLRGEIDKYTWVDIGSSYLMSDINAAFLYGQLESADEITSLRRKVWDHYNAMFLSMERNGCFKLPHIPKECNHNSHIFYIILNNHEDRNKLLASLKENGIGAVFHYVPLHSSPMGSCVGHSKLKLPVTENLASCVVRLPLYSTMTEQEVDVVVDSVNDFFK